MLPLNNTFGGRRVQSCVWGGGVTDEYSQAASGGTVVNYIFFFFAPLCLLGFVCSATGHDGPSCTAHLLGSEMRWLVQYG